MIPTRLIRRNITRLAFIIPVFWFTYFILSLYINDLSDSGNDVLFYNKENVVESKLVVKDLIHSNNLLDKSINKNTIFDESKLVRQIHIGVNKSDVIENRVNAKPIEHSEAEEVRETLEHDDEISNDDEHGEKDVSEKEEEKAVLLAPNHPEKQLIDPNAPGKKIVKSFI